MRILQPGDGALIAIEGPEGTGKTTLVKALSQELDKIGHKHIATKEAYTEEWKPHVDRGNYQASIADRAAHVREVIIPGVRSGATVITDRYVASGVAHASDGFKPERLWDQLELFPVPDAWIFLGDSPHASWRRMVLRDGHARHGYGEHKHIYKKYDQLISDLDSSGFCSMVMRIDPMSPESPINILASFVLHVHEDMESYRGLHR